MTILEAKANPSAPGVQQQIDALRAYVGEDVDVDVEVIDPDDLKDTHRVGFWEVSLGAGAFRADFVAHSEILTFLRSAKSGTLLEYAKHGISAIHGRHRDKAPHGRRLISTISLRDVIWEARNQAIHFEDPVLSSKVNIVFNALEASDPGQFATFSQQVNKAFEVVNKLGWRNWDAFEVDMMSLS